MIHFAASSAQYLRSMLNHSLLRDLEKYDLNADLMLRNGVVSRPKILCDNYVSVEVPGVCVGSLQTIVAHFRIPAKFGGGGAIELTLPSDSEFPLFIEEGDQVGSITREGVVYLTGSHSVTEALMWVINSATCCFYHQDLDWNPVLELVLQRFYSAKFVEADFLEEEIWTRRLVKFQGQWARNFGEEGKEFGLFTREMFDFERMEKMLLKVYLQERVRIDQIDLEIVEKQKKRKGERSLF